MTPVPSTIKPIPEGDSKPPQKWAGKGRPQRWAQTSKEQSLTARGIRVTASGSSQASPAKGQFVSGILEGKEKSVRHGTCSQREAPFWTETRALIYPGDPGGRRAPPLGAPNGCGWLPVLTWDNQWPRVFPSPSGRAVLSPDCFPFFQLTQTTAVLVPTFSGCFPLSSRLFSLCQTISCCYGSSLLPLSVVSAGCLRFPRAQLHFRGASGASQGCFWLTGLVPRLAALRLTGIFCLGSSSHFLSVCPPL